MKQKHLLALVLFFLILSKAKSQNYNPVSYYFNGTPTHGIKIKTNLPFQNGLGMPTVMLEGYDYGDDNTIDIKINWYVYNGIFNSANASSSGSYSPAIKLANENGLVVIFIDDRKYYNRFNVRVYANGKGETATMFEGWTVVDEAINGTGIKNVEYKTSLPGMIVGNVGIGTANPTNKLDVRGVIASTHDIGNKLAFFTSGDGNSYLNFTGGSSTSRLGFQIDGGSKMSIYNNGSVAIGTGSTGTHKLAVEGSIGAREIKVEVGTWSDYVFKEGYDLPTLEEVERHIKEKGHLINIPSAKEVEANGIELGEMNKLLLEKIEELTLYVLELKSDSKKTNALMEKQDERIKELEQRLKK
ncbi:hypothetical protein SAMN04487891_1185 [Flagellimonas taeanensis]|uniref:Uncharacterized protein n=2 Tax=Flagellimonas taeanensis TaxID=1005926 RepID=A0A1M7CUX3_9FLAO|nr:hypothetical protein SAMN04487891_1185 [Allomuricauda taeanensis]SHL71025.1 hypothetical protein SAMN05216293_4125 [Allomuricauda taeanensis]